MTRTRTTTISAEEMVGNPAAPFGSREWAVSVRGAMHDNLKEIDGDTKSLREYAQLFIQHRGWSVLSDDRGRPFRSYEAFCVARFPFGLGRQPEEIEAVIAERERRKSAQAMAADDEVGPLFRHGGDHTTEDAKATLSDNVAQRGVSSEYIVRRLKRDAPEIAAALARDEYPSARAAAIAAGIVKVKTPLEQLRHWWGKASASERAAFLADAEGA